MKNTFKLLLLIITLSFVGCEDPIETTTPIVVKPPIVVTPPTPTTTIFKPAVKNIFSSPTSRTSATKHLVKLVKFHSKSVSDTKYKIKLSQSEYIALPTDNLYDPTEEILNIDFTKPYTDAISTVYSVKTYTYNSSSNLEKITIDNIMYPAYNDTPGNAPIIFEYNSSGSLLQITKYQEGGIPLTYEYNSVGQIINAKDIGGGIKYTFEYDAENNIISKYLYISGTKHMHYTYIYLPDNSYIKNWFSVVNGVETKDASVKYRYNKNVSGVYNNEAIYKALWDSGDSVTGLPFLHITSDDIDNNPKYFYDADGYLIKYDKAGKNDANDITLFIYE
jgi:hypothetical protein